MRSAARKVCDAHTDTVSLARKAPGAGHENGPTLGGEDTIRYGKTCAAQSAVIEEAIHRIIAFESGLELYLSVILLGARAANAQTLPPFGAVAVQRPASLLQANNNSSNLRG